MDCFLFLTSPPARISYAAAGISSIACVEERLVGIRGEGDGLWVTALTVEVDGAEGSRDGQTKIKA